MNWFTARKLQSLETRLLVFEADLDAAVSIFNSVQEGTKIPGAIVDRMMKLPGRIAELRACISNLKG